MEYREKGLGTPGFATVHDIPRAGVSVRLRLLTCVFLVEGWRKSKCCLSRV